MLPEMEAEEHRAIWTGFGGALFVGGMVVTADWTFAVRTAPTSAHVSFNSLPIWVAIVVMLVGIYTFCAAQTSTWTLPGRGALQKRQKIRRDTEKCLARFQATGTVLIVASDSTEKAYQDWFGNLCEFVAQAWGIHETMILFPNATPQYPGALRESVARLAALTEGVRHTEPVEGFDPNSEPKPSWLVYLDRVFSGKPEEST